MRDGISDFSCKYIWLCDELLSALCSGYIEKSRKSYNEKGADFDEIRGEIAKKLSLDMILVNSLSTQRDFTKLPAENHHLQVRRRTKNLHVMGLFQIFSDYK